MLVRKFERFMPTDKKYPKRSTPESRAFGRKLAEAREGKKLTQEQVTERLSHELGRVVQRGYTGNLEAGKVQRPGQDVLAALETILDIPRSVMLQALGLLPSDPAEKEAILFAIHRIGDLPPAEQEAAIEALPPRTQDALRKISLGWFERSMRKVEK